MAIIYTIHPRILLYVADLLSHVQHHQLSPHVFADDTQIYGLCRPGSTDDLSRRVSNCVDDVSLWMRANRLQLNPSKMEVLWCSSGQRRHQIPTTAICICSTLVQPAATVQNLGVFIDADVGMKAHIAATVRSCFAALLLLRSVRRCLPHQALLTLIRALVVSKVDYCFRCWPVSPVILDRLQSVLNAGARLIFSARWSDHITPLLHDLHWLQVPERIQFRLCVLAFRCLHGTAPTYLAESLQRTTPVEGRRHGHLRSADTMLLTVPPTQRSTLGDRSFPAAAARSWNRLPASIRNVSSVATFRRRLKNHLLRSSCTCSHL